MNRCGYRARGVVPGRRVQCQQAAPEGERRCAFHRWMLANGIRPDEYYHLKVLRGLVTPSVGEWSESEVRALMEGRRRGDGRRLDQWVT